MNKKNSQEPSTITPTLFQGQNSGGYTPQNNSNHTNANSGSTTNSAKTLTIDEFKKELPIVLPNFTIDYSDRLQKYVIDLQTDNAQDSYYQWVAQNQEYAPFLSAEKIIVAHQSVTELNAALDYANQNKLSPEQQFKKNNDAILSIINILFSPIANISPSKLVPTITPTSAPGLSPSPAPTKKPKQPKNPPQSNSGSDKYTYFAQCGGQYDDYLLPVQNGTNGKKCTECGAGCGPTTATMILASYIDSSLTPPKVIEDMYKNGVIISCNGSGIYDIYSYMQSKPGIKLTSIMTFNNSKSEQVIGDFKNYLNTGWTLFVLARFEAGGHYFWVTDVNNEGDILAYDPYYGSGRARPFNENQYYPYPNYVAAFAVKKT
jgi:hypothetical protein